MSTAIHPIAGLKAALRNRLLADPAVTALVGTAIYEAPPRATSPPYLVLGDVDAREAGTGEAEGLRVEIEISAVTAERGTAAALALAVAVAEALAAPFPASGGQHLLVLALRQMSTRHDPTTGLARVTQRLSALTESL